MARECVHCKKRSRIDLEPLCKQSIWAFFLCRSEVNIAGRRRCDPKLAETHGVTLLLNESQ